MHTRIKSLIAVIISVAAACTDRESPESDICIGRELSFTTQNVPTSVDNITKGYVKGVSLYETATARSTETTPRQLMVTARLYPQDEQDYDYLTDEVFSLNNGWWRHDPPIYWPLSSRMDFLFWTASIPFSTIEHASNNGAESMKMSVTEEYLQDDILFGSLWQQGESATMNIKMKHAQAWFTVALKNTGAHEVTVNRVTVSDVFTSGVLEVWNNYGDARFDWDFRSSTAKDHIMSDTGGVYGTPLTDDYVFLDVLLPEQDKTMIHIDFNKDGTDSTAVFDLSHSRWLAGNNYRYDFDFK